jgi:hypothetical protein
VITNDEWEQFADGDRLLPILRTLPGKVIGPGHNSIVRGPNNRELFAVYHRWTDEGRVLAIDRLDFAGDRMFVTGATTTPQPAPFRPATSLSDLAECSGSADWKFSATEAVSSDRGGTLSFSVPEAFLLEANVRLAGSGDGEFGVRLDGDTRPQFGFGLAREDGNSICSVLTSESRKSIDISEDLDTSVFHLIRIERNGSLIRTYLDGIELMFERISANGSASTLSIFTDNCSGVVSGFALTEGFEETFETDGIHDWAIEGSAVVQNGELRLDSNGTSASIARRFVSENVEVAAAIRVIQTYGDWSFQLDLLKADEDAPVHFRVDAGRPYLRIGGRQEEEFLALQDVFDWTEYHQIRIVKAGDRALVYLDDLQLGTYETTGGLDVLRIRSLNSSITIDTVRLTKI